MHTLDHDVDASEFASDVVTHEVICVVDVDVLHELRFVCGDEIDEGHVKDLLMLVDPVDYDSFDVTLMWRLFSVFIAVFSLL